MNRRQAGLVGGVLLVLSTFGFLLYGGIEENLVYFLTPSELLAKGADAYDAPVRLGGQVAPGTVDWEAETLRLEFELTDGARALRVRSRGAPPAMFRDGIGVVVEGRYTRAGIFESSNVMVKHSNEYRPPAEGHRPEQMYETLLPEGEA